MSSMLAKHVFILFIALMVGLPSTVTPVRAQASKGAQAELRELREEENKIPKHTTTPPALSRTAPPDVFSCQRHFIYRGKTLDCDSNLHWDGEKFRSIVHEVPDAVAELDAYQANRRSVQTLAYVGSLGLLSVLVGFFGARTKDGTDAARFRTLFMGAGLITMGASTGYSLYLLNSNESHLGNMIQSYNQARPADPIELQFGTNFSF
jgi:hypothetical protein